MVDTWIYFHRYDDIKSFITCYQCSKSYTKEYKPFFNVGGELVCYDCVNESSTISYNVKDNLPNLEPNNWVIKGSVQYND